MSAATAEAVAILEQQLGQARAAHLVEQRKDWLKRLAELRVELDEEAPRLDRMERELKAAELAWLEADNELVAIGPEISRLERLMPEFAKEAPTRLSLQIEKSLAVLNKQQEAAKARKAALVADREPARILNEIVQRKRYQIHNLVGLLDGSIKPTERLLREFGLR